jgi:hypothetical protein
MNAVRDIQYPRSEFIGLNVGKVSLEYARRSHPKSLQRDSTPFEIEIISKSAAPCH